mmetsp:Transcript_8993/g.13521  ORF Transcript_8993/g.13521 Transcript_8993/m.13521 type:complete len:1206 (-) Transcript_8993:116-3733(-)|eukprot:CAMPEP_0185034334 /NCGR_PEP_ID=MMETSP1103-20130426/24103_1 /TAXON_ID=36769 /ORGANISM="Paraphysomonas bandaiensis, Strain Caron Lab Isolate" /LENGTH=1205 /DNA_ID=CAMNT_0027570951 /DNA_START=17 /DNA_END=3634 /DNA_ORIENTATION=+
MNESDGYVAIEVEKFGIAFNEIKNESPKFRIDLELVGRGEHLAWASSGSNKVMSSELSGFSEPLDEQVGNDEIKADDEEDNKGDNEENTENASTISLFTVGCNSFQRTKFIDMTEANVNDLLNSYVLIRIVTIGSNSSVNSPAPAKGKKGAPAAEPESTEEVLTEVYCHIAPLVKDNSGVIEINYSLEDLKSQAPRTVIKDSINGTKSFLTLRMLLDNGFCEYTAGGNVIQWEIASLKNIPGEWTIPLVEPQEKGKAAAKGKGKEPPSEDELREKEMQLISNTLNSQSNVVQYSFTIDPPAADEAGDPEVTAVVSHLPHVALSSGRLEFDNTAAAECAVSEEQTLSSYHQLWSLHWGPSPLIFLHRSTVRQLVDCMTRGGTQLVVKIKKSPPPEPENPEPPVKGKEVPEPVKEIEATGYLDISDLCTPDTKGFTLTLSPVGNGLEDTEAVASVAVMLERPLVSSDTFPVSDVSPVDTISMKSVKDQKNRRDVKKELRTEIASFVKEIATEYVSLYPQPPSQEESMDSRKQHFMYHLSTSGVYHRLKETLKPRIQRVVRERYGARSRALGNTESSIPPAGFSDPEEVPMDEMIGELYVVLVKECNTVLNAMYKSTVIDRDTDELEKESAIDDETETPQQRFFRLFKLAGDAEADKRYNQAEQFHLERIALLKHEVQLSTDPQAPHHAYFQFHEYLMRRAADVLITEKVALAETSEGEDSEANGVSTTVESLREQAREAIYQAINAKKNHWMSYLQLGCLLLETDQQERAGDALLTAIRIQLDDGNENQRIETLDEFKGYESDKLCPVHPMSYVMLTLYYSKIGSPLCARKAIRLAIRSFAEGNYEPAVSTHGKPRRTAVLCLSEGAVFLYEHGMPLLGDLCTQLALDCELAATKKAEERNLPASTIPSIRHMLKKAQAFGHLFRGNVDTAIDDAESCIAVAVDPAQIVKGNLCVARYLSYSSYGDKVDRMIKAFSSALKVLEKNEDYELIPLADYIDMGKSLIHVGRYNDAFESMLIGCRVYPSSSLFHLVGICCIRLDRMIDAEDALHEANLLDNRNPEVWAYLCILCLSTDGHRLQEGMKCSDQALRLGLSNAAILREIATAYIAVDKLRYAEDLIRRAMATDSAEGNGKSSSHTRRLLGDVLAAQNHAAQAVDEYQCVIENNEADLETRIAAGRKCLTLLQTLGRNEEVNQLESIINALESSV